MMEIINYAHINDNFNHINKLKFKPNQQSFVGTYTIHESNIMNKGKMQGIAEG